MNKLFFGDCLDIIRQYIDKESVDLIYLDPPFNSKRDYNLLFKSPKGHESEAQITAFEDSWHWGEQAEREFSLILSQSNTDVAEVIQALRKFLGENDMMAYLTMMASRLLDLHHVLKPTGSLYLHCDPTASHYLKIVLDAVFGKECFVNEIDWKRTGAHSDAKQGSKHYGRVHDIIFFYAKNPELMHWNPLWSSHDDSYINSHYNNIDDNGRRYRWDNLTGPGGAAKGNPFYEVLGVSGYWRYSKVKMGQYVSEGKVAIPPNGKKPALKRYLDEQKGTPISDMWDDISAINSQAQERLGYPTQKPQALLERIIQASSNEGDIVLDPFCGCGTAVHAAQKLNRQWIGVDITHLAITLIEKRLKDAFPGIQYEVYGKPTDFEGARALAEKDKYQFQWWACSLVGAQPFQGKKKGADGGIDGLIFFQDEAKGMAKKIVVSVKGGENVGLTMLKDLIATVDGNQAQIGLFVTLAEPSKPMETEAVKAGFYDSPHFGRFRKIQILTISDLMSGKARPEYPVKSGDLTFKKAKLEDRVKEQSELF